MSLSAKESASLTIHWDYRVMAVNDSDDICFELHKMYYDENGAEKMYNATPATPPNNDSIPEVASYVSILKTASQRPVIWRGERFPEVYIIDDDLES